MSQSIGNALSILLRKNPVHSCNCHFEAIKGRTYLLENINDPDGTVGKLLNDGSVYNSVDSLLNDVDALVKKIQENPKKYIKISIF